MKLQLFCLLLLWLTINTQNIIGRGLTGKSVFERKIAFQGGYRFPENITKNVGQPSIKLAEPNQISQAKIRKCSAQFNPKSRTINRGCHQCCRYNWKWAVDYSSSMNYPNYKPLWNVYCMRQAWKQYFFDPTNSQFPCQQKVSTYAFNSNILPGPSMTGYEEFSSAMFTWYPPILFSNSNTVTNYNVAIVKSILLIMESLLSVHGHLNSCLIMLSDGGNPPLFDFIATLYLFTKSWVAALNGRCVCAMCYYVGGSTSGFAQFQSTCKRIQAQVIQWVKDCYESGMDLVERSASKIFNPSTCRCRK